MEKKHTFKGKDAGVYILSKDDIFPPLLKRLSLFRGVGCVGSIVSNVKYSTLKVDIVYRYHSKEQTIIYSTGTYHLKERRYYSQSFRER